MLNAVFIRQYIFLNNLW